MASPHTELCFVLSCHRSSKWQMRLLQRWTSCWQQRPRSCLDKHHPNCQRHHKHHPNCPGAGMGCPSPSPARGQQPQGWAGAALCPGCCHGCLGVCWREGGALLAAFIQLGTELDELRSEIKYQEGELETAGGTGGGQPCSLCAPSAPGARATHGRSLPVLLQTSAPISA